MTSFKQIGDQPPQCVCLWRLRRATAIDTGFLETPSEPDIAPDLDGGAPANDRAAAGTASLENHISLHGCDDQGQNNTLNSEIARRFLQLDSDGFERLGRLSNSVVAASVSGNLSPRCATTSKSRPNLVIPIIIKHALSPVLDRRFCQSLDLKA